MTNLRSLAVVKKLAERKESDAMALLRNHQEKLQMDTSQYQQIDGYHRDYLDKIGAQRSTNIDELKSYRLFAHQLSESMGQMKQKMERLNSVIEQLQNNWLQLKKKREAIEELIARAETEARTEEDRIEQKLSDERNSQRSHYENKSPFSS